MKTTSTIATFTTLLSAASAQYTSLIAARSGSRFHLSPVTASGQSLWLGKDTASYCPANIEDLGGCPDGDSTTFIGGDPRLSMGVVVPGGQQVYIEPDCGAVMYTIAHSAAMPRDAITDGWTSDPGSGEEDQAFGYLNWENGLLACSESGDAEEGPWKIHAAIDGVEFGDECLGFNALSSNVTEAGAWQYT